MVVAPRTFHEPIVGIQSVVSGHTARPSSAAVRVKCQLRYDIAERMYECEHDDLVFFPSKSRRLGKD